MIREDIEMLRSQVREEIFKILFRIPFIEEEELSEQIDFAMEDLEGKSEENRDYIKNKSMEVLLHINEIDAKITDCCEGWNINRIGKAELAIMRLAVYEILFEDDVPEKVAINEAVELSKIYGDDNAKGFINAVLGKVVKSI